MPSAPGGSPRAGESETPGGMKPGRSLLPEGFTLDMADRRLARLFMEAAARPPAGTPRITTLASATLSGRGAPTTVGLTTYASPGGRPTQKISLFSSLIGELSDSAALGVMAHELAHAWLNEHRSPEDSRAREREADALAREWGFSRELDALDSEAETVNG